LESGYSYVTESTGASTTLLYLDPTEMLTFDSFTNMAGDTTAWVYVDAHRTATFNVLTDAAGDIQNSDMQTP